MCIYIIQYNKNNYIYFIISELKMTMQCCILTKVILKLGKKNTERKKNQDIHLSVEKEKRKKSVGM